MSIHYIFGLLGGLALFLYGMELMSRGLELAAGDRLRSIIEKMTSSTLRGILVGTLVAGIIQSSSATTVMVVGFVNAGIMTIYQAVGIIMGANIGTTVTGQLVALNITVIAPLLAFVGFVLNTFSKKKFRKYMGQVIIGLGFLFMGMEFMSKSMEPLRQYPGFITLMTKFSNPFLGILIGTTITAIIQSSSASLGILQAIANEGLIPFHSSMYIVCGFNIGTCITSVISSIGSSNNAKRTAAVHVLFNLIGTIIFVMVSFVFPVDKFIISISKDLPAAQIANLHTLFNVGTTILLFPLSRSLANMSSLIIRGEEKQYDELSLQFINYNVTKDSNAMFTDIRAEATRMLHISRENFRDSMDLFHNYSEEKYDEVFHREEAINYLNKEITQFIIKGMGASMDEAMSNNYAGYLRIVRDIERIGDHTKAIADAAKFSVEKELPFSEMFSKEMDALRTSLMTMFKTLDGDMPKVERNRQMKFFEEKLERYVEEYRNAHMDRMKEGVCDPESGLVYEKVLTALDRVSAYLSNASRLAI